MNAPTVIVEGRRLELGQMIGRGGEGTVYAVAGNATSAVKLYTTKDLRGKEDKVAAMVAHKLASRWPLAAFPLAIVYKPDGDFAGFVMRLVAGHRPLHELYAPGARKQHFPQADYRFLVRAATNIARAMASVHQAGCVVGDVNHSGILISPKATAALIDADSFQFSERSRQHLCRVGVPEYTPPELQGLTLDGAIRTVDHDSFSLAIVLFQLLMMGRHPFVGAVKKGEIPPLHENIQHYRYVYAEGRDVGMIPPPGTPKLTAFSRDLSQTFDRAFSRTAQGARPTAQDWAAALERLESSLIQCSANRLHYGPSDAASCAWCDMESKLGTTLFLPYVPQAAPTVIGEVRPSDFDLATVWLRIRRVSIPAVEQLLPQLPTATFTASANAVITKNTKPKTYRPLAVVLAAAGVGILFLGPNFIPLSLAAWLAAVVSFFWTPAPSVNRKTFREEEVLSLKEWERALASWRDRAGIVHLSSLKDRLETSKRAFEAQMLRARSREEEFRSRRRANQLERFLEGFDITRGKISGIGPAKIAVLASYGIGTAADITDARLGGVPGFGPALTSRLKAWRQTHEARFHFNATITDTDRRELARIQSESEAALAPLRQQLVAGAVDLEKQASRMQTFLQQQDPLLVKAHARLQQAQVDLAFLGMSPSPMPSTPNRPLPAPVAPASRSMIAAAGVKFCPRCGSPMMRRTARQGAGAGRDFWGCSRYPRCKGTVAI